MDRGSLTLQQSMTKNHPQEEERQNGCLRRALQIAEERREAKGKGEKERCIHLNAEFQKIARRGKKAFFK